MEINFVDGKAVLKKGKKVVAKIYDRKVFYAVNNIKAGYSFPYSLEMPFGIAECKDLDEVKNLIAKYWDEIYPPLRQ